MAKKEESPKDHPGPKHTLDDIPSAQPKPRHWWIPQFLLSRALYLFFFRIVLALAISFTTLMAWQIAQLRGEEGARDSIVRVMVPVLSGALLMVIHHIGTAFGPRFFPLPAWLDICLTKVEFAAFFALSFLISLDLDFDPKSGTVQIVLNLLLLICIWCPTSSVGILSLLKIAHLLNERPQSLLKEPVRIAGPQSHLDRWWVYPVHAIFGRRLWRECVPGESAVLTTLRGCLALLALLSLLGFGFRQTILLPLSEMGRTPYRTYRTRSLGDNVVPQLPDNETEDVNIILVWPASRRTSALSLVDVVTANTTTLGQNGTTERCRVESIKPQDKFAKFSFWRFEVAVVACPVHQPFSSAISYKFPDISLSINYTGVLGNGTLTGGVLPTYSVDVYFGLTNDTGRILENTEPVSLFPGTNMLSVASIVVRQRYTETGMGLLGFEPQAAFFVASIAQTIPNPFAGPVTNPNISTLTFALRGVANEWIFIQDYQERSVVSGLSQFGGFGSLLSTLFGIILGTSLVQIFARTRPSSPFGLLHNIEKLKIKMVKKCEEKYPALQADLLRIEREQGLFAFLTNTLVDVEPLRNKVVQNGGVTQGVSESAKERACDSLSTAGEGHIGARGAIDGTAQGASETEPLMQERSITESRGVV